MAQLGVCGFLFFAGLMDIKEKARGTSERFHTSRDKTDAGFALLIPEH
jgi:hypothetical protein